MNAETKKPSQWTSLEIAKLIVPTFTALALAVVGVLINWSIQERSKQIDSIVQKRFSLYDQIGQRLNRMFGYYMYVGKWKEWSPEDIVNYKRDLDEIIYTYEPFFSPAFITRYKHLENQMFEHFTGWGSDAKLRTNVTYRREYYFPLENTKVWNPTWNERFTNQDNSEKIREAYSALISALPQELGLPPLSDTHGARTLTAKDVAKSHEPSNGVPTTPR